LKNEGFSPLSCPKCQSETRPYGSRHIEVLTAWGKAEVKLPRRCCPSCTAVKQVLPQGLDSSGLSPKTLLRVIDQATRLPFREAQQALEVQGLSLSLSHVERLTQSYGRHFEQSCQERLHELSELPLEDKGRSRVMVVEADGTFVTERDKPVAGSIEGREVKQVLFYPNNAPSERESYAAPLSADELLPLAHGLMRHAGVKKHDFLIGIADGASWLDSLFKNLGVNKRILDVYHAMEYLERLLVYGQWDEEDRLQERKRWYRGEVNGSVRLAELKEAVMEKLGEPATWSYEAQTDLAYLQTHAARGEMEYADFRKQGWPIGSGQIEGANKSVINARMDRGGMFWSRSGIGRMAALRSGQCSRHPLVGFHETRLQAFNPA
jgi:hypothetical protein